MHLRAQSAECPRQVVLLPSFGTCLADVRARIARDSGSTISARSALVLEGDVRFTGAPRPRARRAPRAALHPARCAGESRAPHSRGAAGRLKLDGALVVRADSEGDEGARPVPLGKFLRARARAQKRQGQKGQGKGGTGGAAHGVL